MDSQMHRSLKRLAIISYAKWFWSKSVIKNKLKYYSSCVEHFDDTPDYWEKLVESIALKLKTIHLPRLLLDEMNYVVLSIGWRIYHWQVFVTRTLSLPGKFVEPLHWTPYGTVDKAEIVEKEWFNTIARFTRSTELYMTAIHYMACSCAISSHIRLFQKEIQALCNTYSTEEFCRKSGIGRGILFMENSLWFFAKELETWEYTPVQTMFRESMEIGNDVAVQFYWNLLSPEEITDSFLLESLMECMDRLVSIRYCQRRPWNAYTEYPRRQYFIDTFAFVVSRMLKLQRRNFFFSKRICSWKTEFLGIFISVEAWPWQELFFPVFEIMKEKFDLTDYYSLLNEIFVNMKINVNYLVCDIQKGIEYKMFLVVWNALKVHRSVENAPLYSLRNSKKKYRKYDNHWNDKNEERYNAYISMIRSAYRLFNIDILKQISDSECDKQGRRLFLSKGNYNELIEMNKFQLLDEFIKVVLKDEEERNWFHKNYDLHRFYQS